MKEKDVGALGKVRPELWTVPPGARVLDLGCAQGLVSAGLAAHGLWTVGLDCSREMMNVFAAESAREAAADVPRGVLGVADHLPFRSGSFDAVIALEVLEHVPDLVAALREIARILRPGGTVVISVPTVLPERLCQWLHPRWREHTGHTSILPRWRLGALLRLCGFDVTAIRGSNSEWTPIAIAHALLKTRLHFTGKPLNHAWLSDQYGFLWRRLERAHLGGVARRVGDHLWPKSWFVYCTLRSAPRYGQDSAAALSPQHPTTWPTVSVVIPTYRRGKQLRDTLSDLFAQTYAPAEIIVVDQTIAHDRETESFLRAAADAGKIRLITTNPPCLPRARNIGLQAAKADIVLFVDDDVALPPGLVAGHAAAYRLNNIAGVGGRVLPPEERPGHYSGVGWVRPAGAFVSNFHFLEPCYIESPIGVNMSFRRDVLLQVGGFDTDYIGSALYEESDLAMRVRRLGYLLVFWPPATLTHLYATSGGCGNRGWDHRYAYTVFHNRLLFAWRHLPILQLPRVYVVGLIQAMEMSQLSHNTVPLLAYVQAVLTVPLTLGRSWRKLRWRGRLWWRSVQLPFTEGGSMCNTV